MLIVSHTYSKKNCLSATCTRNFDQKADQMHKYSLLFLGMVISLAGVVCAAPVAGADPTTEAEPTIQADPSPPCNTQEQSSGTQLAGKTQGPYADRRDHDSAVNAEFNLTCIKSVRVKVTYTIQEESASGQLTTVGNGSKIVDVAPTIGQPACTTGAPCTTAWQQTNTFKVGGSFNGTRRFIVTASAVVYQAGTVFIGGVPLGAQPLQLAPLAESAAML
jgi:hypothetical protein